VGFSHGGVNHREPCGIRVAVAGLEVGLELFCLCGGRGDLEAPGALGEVVGVVDHRVGEEVVERAHCKAEVAGGAGLFRAESRLVFCEG